MCTTKWQKRGELNEENRKLLEMCEKAVAAGRNISFPEQRLTCSLVLSWNTNPGVPEPPPDTTSSAFLSEEGSDKIVFVAHFGPDKRVLTIHNKSANEIIHILDDS